MVSCAVADNGGGWHQWWLAVVGGVGGSSGVGLQ